MHGCIFRGSNSAIFILTPFRTKERICSVSVRAPFSRNANRKSQWLFPFVKMTEDLESREIKIQKSVCWNVGMGKEAGKGAEGGGSRRGAGERGQRYSRAIEFTLIPRN